MKRRKSATPFRRSEKQSPEDTLYRDIRAHMSLPFDFDRLRHAAELDKEPAPSSVPALTTTPAPRRRIPTVAAVAATLAMVCLLGVSGVWIADWLREPPVVCPPLPESDTATTRPQESAPETGDLPETGDPIIDPGIHQDAPETLTLDGITYRKTKTRVTDENIGDAIDPNNTLRLETVCYTIRNLPSEEGIAVLCRNTYILYLNCATNDRYPLVTETN